MLNDHREDDAVERMLNHVESLLLRHRDSGAVVRPPASTADVKDREEDAATSDRPPLRRLSGTEERRPRINDLMEGERRRDAAGPQDPSDPAERRFRSSDSAPSIPPSDTHERAQAPDAPTPEGGIRDRAHVAPDAPTSEADMLDGSSEQAGYDPEEIVREIRSRESAWRIAGAPRPDLRNEPVEPAETNESAEPARSAEPVQSTEPPRSAEPVQSVDPAQSAEPAESAEPVQSVEPAEPAAPVEPAEPEEREQPGVETPRASFAEGADTTHMTRRLCARLGQLLMDEKLLSEGQLEAALRRQKETGERLGSILISEGYLDEKSLLSVLESQHGVPAVHLDEITLEPSLAELIPRDMALRNLMVPFALHPDAVDVAMVDPTDFVSMAHVRFAAGVRPNVFITTVGAAERAIARLYAADEHEASGASEVKEAPTAREQVRRMILERDSVLLASDRDPRKYYELAVSIEDFVDEILRKAREG